MWAVSAVSASLIALVLNSFAARFRFHDNAVVRFAAIGCGVGFILSAGLWPAYGVSMEIAAAILLFAFFCELYIFLFTLVLSSVSVNIMLRLRRGSISEPMLDEIYSGKAMIALRIDRLLQSGLLREVDSLIEATERGRRLASLFNRFRRLFGHS